MIEFNFKIVYRSEIQNTKSDNLIRKFQNLSERQHDERQQFNHRILFKFHYLKTKVRNVINFVSLLMNENQKNVIILAIMLYELNEKKLCADEKSDKKSFAKRVFEKKSTIEKSKKNQRLIYLRFNSI